MLDPENWDDFRAQGHRMLDDMVDSLQHIRQQPVWQDAEQHVKQRFRTPLPASGTELDVLHDEFMQYIQPYAVGNRHPGFMGWVHGGGTPVGMLAEMLAGGLNANLGGRNQIPLEVERQVISWMRDLFGFPESASGVLTTGTSAATLIALITARNVASGDNNVSRCGLPDKPLKLAAYASEEAHGCVARALSVIGLGDETLRLIPCRHHQIDPQALQQQIDADCLAGCTPWLIVGTAGSVNTGAIDKLDLLADIARSSGAWFHVDGAFGALAMLAPEIAPCLRGIERADSLAMDFHKWGQVPYDAGMVLMRDGDTHRQQFSAADAYLQREEQGLAANSPWPCDYGIDLSRGFRALKVWFTFKSFGGDRIGAMISHCCDLAQSLARMVEVTDQLEMMAQVSLNIVCFRYCGDKTLSPGRYDTINRAMICHIQLSGMAAPSLTFIDGRAVIRAAVVNHRTEQQDMDRLLAATLAAAQVCH
ncbi:MAG: pyridoxal-dependent decarboxylase [Mariprofundus sp.]